MWCDNKNVIKETGRILENKTWNEKLSLQERVEKGIKTRSWERN